MEKQLVLEVMKETEKPVFFGNRANHRKGPHDQEQGKLFTAGLGFHPQYVSL